MSDPVATSSAVADQIVGLLREIEGRSRTHALGLPQRVEARDTWEGVIFALGGRRLVAPLDQIVEILNFPPSVTTVPGTRSWMKGIANVRGNLLPIVDLGAFLDGQPTPVERRSRVLVIRQDDGVTGLLVGVVVGMRHFSANTRRDFEVPGGRAAAFVNSAFEQDGETWPVFSMETLAADPEFQMASL